MTNQQYKFLTRQARDSMLTATDEVMRVTAKIYKQSATSLATKLRTLPVGPLTAQDLNSLSMIQELNKLSTNITESLDGIIMDSVRRSSEIATGVDKRYMLELGLDNIQVGDIIQHVNNDVVFTTVNRVYQDGYTFSQRLWIEGQKTQNDIKLVLNSGIAQGRDPIKVAKDLEQYLKDGKLSLMKRYGKLKAGTKEFAARIPNNVDYRAMRIIRTETYNSLRDAELLGAESNPGTTGWFDWIRTAGAEDYGCICPDLAAGSPYKASEVPNGPHPNCSCYVQAQLRNQTEFVADLKDWVAGGDVGYLDEWSFKTGYQNIVA